MHAAESVIQINLLPLEEQHTKRRAAGAPSKSTIIALAAVAIVLTTIAILSFVQGLQVRALRADIDTLQAEANQLRPLIQRIDQLTAEREAVRSRMAVIEQLDRDRFIRVRMADELSRRIPDQVWLTSFTEDSGHLTITGVTFSNLSVAELIASLEKSVMYENVDLQVSRRGTIDQNEVVNFTITAQRQVGAAEQPGTPG